MVLKGGSADALVSLGKWVMSSPLDNYGSSSPYGYRCDPLGEIASQNTSYI